MIYTITLENNNSSIMHKFELSDEDFELKDWNEIIRDMKESIDEEIPF